MVFSVICKNVVIVGYFFLFLILKIFIVVIKGILCWKVGVFVFRKDRI